MEVKEIRHKNLGKAFSAFVGMNPKHTSQIKNQVPGQAVGDVIARRFLLPEKIFSKLLDSLDSAVLVSLYASVELA